MAERAANLVDFVIPYVPNRQWVLSLPFALRYVMAWNHRLSRKVLRCFYLELDKFYRKRARKKGIRRAKTGAVTIIQRAGGAMNLNVHFHTDFLDGTFTMDAEGKLEFHDADAPTEEEIKKLVKKIRKRVLKMLKREKIEIGRNQDEHDDPLADEYPALAAACSASIQQLVALGPRAGRRVVRLGQDPDPEAVEHANKFKNTRRARYKGFDLCASPPVPPRDRKRLERMLRYMLRPPIAQGRLRETADGKIALDLKQPWDDGTCAIVFEPLELLEKIAAIIPRPQSNQIIYHGVLGPAAKWRKQVVKYGRPDLPDMTPVETDGEPDPEPENGYIPWAELMRRTLDPETECTRPRDRGGSGPRRSSIPSTERLGVAARRRAA